MRIWTRADLEETLPGTPPTQDQETETEPKTGLVLLPRSSNLIEFSGLLLVPEGFQEADELTAWGQLNSHIRELYPGVFNLSVKLVRSS